MAPPPNPKRQHLPSSPSSDTATATTTRSHSLDAFLNAALAIATDPTVPIELSLSHILDSTPLWSDRVTLLDRAMAISSALADAVARGRNPYGCWPLPYDLTLKVLSMMDTRSVCCAAATCKLFRKCSSDPLCYANIDFTRSVTKVTNRVVSSMILRAGKNLHLCPIQALKKCSTVNIRSIKIGSLHEDNSAFSFGVLSFQGSCLAPLVWNGGSAGLLLRRLHLYNIHMEVGDHGFCSTLSACQSLVELKIVGLDVRLVNILTTIHEHCHFIEHLHLEVRADKYWGISDREAMELKILLKKCPLLSFLAIRGYRIDDDLISVLVKEAFALKSLDLSGSHRFSGIFLSDLGNGDSANSLETLILCECDGLKAELVSDFLLAISRGDWKALRYVDISNSQGLVYRYNWTECTRCWIEVSWALEGRPDIHLIADYPQEIYFYDCMSQPSPRSRYLAYLNAWPSGPSGRGDDAAASSAQS